MVKIFFYKLSVIFLNLIVPGAGLAALGYWRLAFITLLSLITPLVLLCFSRTIFEPMAIQCLLIFTALIYIISAILCCYLPRKTSEFAQYKKRYNHLAVGLFVLAAAVGTTAGFIYKHHWLGVNVFFVPSMSMFPILKPGEFILVDSWAYHNKSPDLNDIVVFKQKRASSKEGKQGVTWLVKRISYWPNNTLQHNKQWYVLGDNAQSSHDSRYFGGIQNKDIIGKVRLILTGINAQNTIVSPSSFQRVD